MSRRDKLQGEDGEVGGDILPEEILEYLAKNLDIEVSLLIHKIQAKVPGLRFSLEQKRELRKEMARCLGVRIQSRGFKTTRNNTSGHKKRAED